METQRCGHCREEKDLAEFALSYRGRPGTWCRACMRARYVPRPRPPLPEVPKDQGRCSRCEEIKPVAEFYFSKGKQNPWCKDCFREWHRERYTPQDGANDQPRACAVCGKVYQPKQRMASVYCSKVCQQRERKSSGRERDRYLQRTYGITAADYDRLLEAQGGGCALCGVKPEDLTAGRFRTFLHVDHCHDTGRVRGLLCPEHNLLLGQFGDSPAMFRRILDYLEAAASV